MVQRLLILRYSEERRKGSHVKGMMTISTPFTLECRSRKTSEEFVITSDFMTTITITFSSSHYMEPGDILDMSIPFEHGEGSIIHMTGEVLSCVLRGSTRFMVFEGLIELRNRESLQLDVLREYAEKELDGTRNCA